MARAIPSLRIEANSLSYTIYSLNQDFPNLHLVRKPDNDKEKFMTGDGQVGFFLWLILERLHLPWTSPPSLHWRNQFLTKGKKIKIKKTART